MASLNNYNFTKHADERLMERFLVTKNNRQAFVTNFMTKGGHFVTKNKDGTELWESGEIVLVVNPESQTIITAYHKYQKENDNGLVDDFLTDIAEQARLLKKRVVKDSLPKIEELIQNVSESTRPLKNTHDDIVDNAFEDLYKNVTELKNYLGKVKAYRVSADKVKERNL